MPNSTGPYGSARGSGTSANASNATAEGDSTTASGASSHAEGSSTTASGASSHAEGLGGTSSGAASHVEGGTSNTASGDYSHVEGGGAAAADSNIASAAASHAEGKCSAATLLAQHAQASGRFASRGDAQYSNVVLRNSTTWAAGPAVTAILYIDGAAALFTLVNAHSYSVRGLIVARNNDANASSTVIRFEGGSKMDGGIAANIGAAYTSTVVVEDAPGTHTVSVTTNAAGTIDITASHAVTAGTTQWVCYLEVVETELALA